MAGIGQRMGQIGERHGHMAVIEGPLLAAYGQRLLEQGDRPLGQALAPIGKADAFEELGGHFGLQVHVSRDFCRAPIQKILGGGLPPLGVERVRLREHIHEEGRHLLRPIALLGGRLPRQFDAAVSHNMTPANRARPRNRAAAAPAAMTCRRRNLAVL